MNARLTHLLDMLNSEPGDAFLQYAVALEYRALGQETEAVFALESLVAEHPDYVPAYYPLGELLFKAKDSARADSIIQKGIAVALRQNDPKTATELRSLLEDFDF